MRCALALVAALVALSGGAASAFEFRLLGTPLRLDVTESLYLNYHGTTGQPDPTSDNYGELLSRLNLQLAWGRFLVGVRADSAGYVHTPQEGARIEHPTCLSPSDPSYVAAADRCLVHPGDARLLNRFHTMPLYLEKIFASYSGRNVEATLGDFYVNFGRGLVLSIRKVDELGIDTTLRGGKLALHVGDLSAVAAAGWANIQNVDEATAYYTEGRYSFDPKSPRYDTQSLCTLAVGGCNDFLAGAHLDYRLGGRVTVGAHAVGGLPARPFSLKQDTTDYHLRAGGLVDAPRLTDWLALYAEYAHAEDHLGGASTSGEAFYGAATLYGARSVLLVEVKDYVRYAPWSYSAADPKSPVYGALVYQQVPTLERVITQINNDTDILAARARLDLRLDPSLLVYGSLELGESHPSPDTTDRLADLYFGAELRWDEGRSHCFPLVGYRREEDTTGGRLEEELVALEWDAAQALPRGWSIETQGLVWLRSKPLDTPNDNTWREGNVYVSLKWTPRLVLVAGYEFTTLRQEQANQHDFFNGSIQWNITPATSLRVFAGGNRPGLKCISGVCRVFPAFQGARLELVVRL